MSSFPAIINLPTNAPLDIQGVGQFLTQAVQALQIWAMSLPNTIPAAGDIANLDILANISGSAAPATGQPLSSVLDATLGNTDNKVAMRIGGAWSAGFIANANLSAGAYPNITGLGTVGSGTWQAAAIGLQYGGTGADLHLTGGASQVLKQAAVGAAVTVGQLAAADLSNGTTGTGAVVLASSPALTTPNLGTPSAVTLTNATGLPISTGVSGLGTGVATFLATPSSANLKAAVTDETGSGGALVFATGPTISGLTVTGSFTATGLVTNADLANSSVTLNSHALSLGGSLTLAFSDFSGTIAATQLPNPSATTLGGIESAAAVAHQWIDSISTLGVPHLSQPAFTDISGTLATATQLDQNSVTVGTTAIVLGATAATVTGLTVSGGTLSGSTTLPGSGLLASGGSLLLGFNTTIVSGGPTLQIVGATPILGAYQFAANASDGLYIFGKSRGSTTTAGAVISGDALGEFNFRGDDGSTNGKITVTSAVIRALVDGTVATGVVPGRLIFQTMNTGGTLAERMRLQSSGGLSLGTTTDPGSGNLLVSGTYTANTAGSSLGDQIVFGATVATSTLTVTSSTTLTLVPGLQVTVAAGKTYSFSGWLHGTSGASGGIKVAIGGSCTATSILAQAFCYNGTTAVANTTTTTKGASIVASTAIYTDIYIEGAITVNAGGTLSIVAAQNVSNATSTTVQQGSTFTILRND